MHLITHTIYRHGALFKSQAVKVGGGLTMMEVMYGSYQYETVVGSRSTLWASDPQVEPENGRVYFR